MVETLMFWTAGWMFTAGATDKDGWALYIIWPYALGKHFR